MAHLWLLLSCHLSSNLSPLGLPYEQEQALPLDELIPVTLLLLLLLLLFSLDLACSISCRCNLSSSSTCSTAHTLALLLQQCVEVGRLFLQVTLLLQLLLHGLLKLALIIAWRAAAAAAAAAVHCCCLWVRG
jgi:hypothetical protein